MQKLIYSLVLGVFLIGCSASSPSGSKSLTVLTASSFDCEKSFQTDWCSQNLQTSSNITSVCKGSIYSGDIIYSSLYIKSTLANSCLVDLGLGSQSVNITGCANAIQTDLSSTSGAVTVLSCYSTTGSDVYVEGTLANGQSFRALHIQWFRFSIKAIVT